MKGVIFKSTVEILRDSQYMDSKKQKNWNIYILEGKYRIFERAETKQKGKEREKGKQKEKERKRRRDRNLTDININFRQLRGKG